MMRKVPDDGFDYLELEIDPLPVLDEQNLYIYPDGRTTILWDSHAAAHGFCPGCMKYALPDKDNVDSLYRDGLCLSCMVIVSLEMGADFEF